MKEKADSEKNLMQIGRPPYIQDSATTTRIEFAIGNLAIQLFVVG